MNVLGAHLGAALGDVAVAKAQLVLSQLLTGQNIFRGPTVEDSRQRVIKTPIPDFTQLNAELEPRLNAMLHRALARDLAQRYQTADDMLYELEYFIYHRGYGPTNETLGKFVRELFAEDPSRASRTRAVTTRIRATSKTVKSQTPSSPTVKTRPKGLIHRIKSQFQ